MKTTRRGCITIIGFSCVAVILLAQLTGPRNAGPEVAQNSTSATLTKTAVPEVADVTNTEVPVVTEAVQGTATVSGPQASVTALLATVYVGQTQAAVTPAPTVTAVPPTSTPIFDQLEYIRLISDGLFITAGGRNIQSILVPDGRANGGERSIQVSYLTTESTEVGFADEIIDILSGIAATIRADDLDVDGVTLLAGSPLGAAIATIYIPEADLMAYHHGQISRSQLVTRLVITTF